ncbi:DDB1- and CUL4-associated factor 5-like [Saccoglossus kowalevskii]|uniref:DDB1- and CUL4-associated factor 5-like n=1 Tax=Saccoglossus kowalevskii TaxID=10224 RepID=A0ABM0M2H9_SACKO|nr:PREDICTED: DDB1- and CUL4-associated factor 5-like [Saccoglossus kowalevskii]
MPRTRNCSTTSPISCTFRRQETGNSTLCGRYIRDRFHRCQSLFKKDLLSHFGCVNAIEFSNNGGEFLISGGDDRRVLLWNVEKAISGLGKAVTMKGEHNSNIFCLAFSSSNNKVFSSGNDEQVIVHDVHSGEAQDVFLHEDTVYGLSVQPDNDNIYASACDDGRVLIWDIRDRSGQEPFVLANYTSAFHAVVYNPVEPTLLATASSKEGVGLWDVRAPRTCLLRYGGSLLQQSAMSVKFNCTGDRLVSLRRRLPPVLYDIQSAVPLIQFDHSGYYNSCTMKSCCFAGDSDQYILSGSDDFNLYLWKIPEGNLEGHLIWSPFKLPESVGTTTGGMDMSEVERNMYSHEEYIDLVLNSGQGLSHDYTHKSMHEDPRMIAFFDSLVQREVEGWSSLSDSDDSLLSGQNFYVQLMERESNVPSDDESLFAFSSSDGNTSRPEDLAQSAAELRRLFDMRVVRPNSDTANNTESATSQPSPQSFIQLETPSRIRRVSLADTTNVNSDTDVSNEETHSLPSNSPGPSQSNLGRWLNCDYDSDSSNKLLSSVMHLDHDRLISLRQRIACRRALREKLSRRSVSRNNLTVDDSSSSSSDDEDTGTRLQSVSARSRSVGTASMSIIRSLRRRIHNEDALNNDNLDSAAPVGVDGEYRDNNTSSEDVRLDRSKRTCNENCNDLQPGCSKKSKPRNTGDTLPSGSQPPHLTLKNDNSQDSACNGAQTDNLCLDAANGDCNPVNGNNNENNWPEFRRFKNRVARTKRNYRRNETNDSDD